MLELTDEQQDAVQQGNKFTGVLLTIGGAAGTGKSTILKEMLQPGDAVIAYTGKAASVLRKKKVKATTIHSRIYEFDGERFQLRDKLPDIKRFIIDEASMVGGKIFDDLLSFRKPIIAIGDHCQLKPVNDTDINLMEKPDVTLEKIHRQAEGNPIIKRATAVRLRNEFTPEGPAARLDDHLSWADIVLCGFNKTRVHLNEKLRPFPNQTIEEGERIICLVNDQQLGCYNGQAFEVLKIRKQSKQVFVVDLKDDNGATRTGAQVWLGGFGKLKTPSWKTTKRYQGRAMIADYGYAITVHKSQGSEWEKVLVYNQPCKLWDHQRWLYTAITRASQEVKVFGNS